MYDRLRPVLVPPPPPPPPTRRKIYRSEILQIKTNKSDRQIYKRHAVVIYANASPLVKLCLILHWPSVNAVKIQLRSIEKRLHEIIN